MNASRKQLQELINSLDEFKDNQIVETWCEMYEMLYLLSKDLAPTKNDLNDLLDRIDNEL